MHHGDRHRTLDRFHYRLYPVVETEPARVRPSGDFGIPALLAYRFVLRPVRFALCLAAILLASTMFKGVHGQSLLTERSFFGVLRVTVDSEGKYRQLVHGNTVHGRHTSIRNCKLSRHSIIIEPVP